MKTFYSIVLITQIIIILIGVATIYYHLIFGDFRGEWEPQLAKYFVYFLLALLAFIALVGGIDIIKTINQE